MWQRGLADFSYDECTLALETWLNQEKFPPTLADLKSIVAKVKNPTAFVSGEKAWERVIQAIKRFGWPSEAAAMKTLSPNIKRAINNLGGWQKLCATSDKEMDFRRKDFLAVYDEFESKNQEQILLPEDILKRIKEIQEQQLLDKPEEDDEQAL